MRAGLGYRRATDAQNPDTHPCVVEQVDSLPASPYTVTKRRPGVGTA